MKSDVIETFGSEILYQTKFQKFKDDVLEILFEAKFSFLNEQDVIHRDEKRRRPWNNHVLQQLSIIT